MISKIVIATYLLTSLVQATVPIANVEDLLAVVQIFRYGEKTPIYHYKGDPWTDKIDERFGVGPGQLTLTGKRKLFDLGQFTRQRYEEFLPLLYDETWFKAYATDDDVTLTSAEAYLSAFFWPKVGERFIPELPWQPVPVHPIPKEVLSQMPNCPTYWMELDNVLKTNQFYRAINAEYADAANYIRNHTGIDCTLGLNALRNYYILHIEHHLKLELPSWTNSIYPQPLSFLAETSLQALTHTNQMKRIYAGPWLHTIFNSFVDIFEEPESNPIFQIYAAHDYNILALLRTLGTTEPFAWPAFASSLYFELRNSSGIPTVTIWYKNDKLGIFKQIDVRRCGYKCTLGDFGRALRDYLVDVETWKEECSIRQPPLIESPVDDFSYYRDIIRKTAFRTLSMNEESRALIKEEK